MDLIKKMIDRRVQLGVTESKPTPKGHVTELKSKTLSQRKREIIENTPKAKIVKEYFEDLVAELEADTSDDE